MIMLAIAAHQFDSPSETFIRDHILHISPDATILICQDGRGAERLGYPVLSNLNSWRHPGNFRGRVFNAVRYRWQTYVNPALAAADRRRLLTFLEQYRPDAVLAEFGPVGCLIGEACRLAAVPLFVHFHGYDASILLREAHWVRHYRQLFQIAAGIIAPSRFLVDKLSAIGCPSGKLHVSHNGIDVTRFRCTARVPDRLLAIGRLVEKKAPHLTIRAFASISSRFPNARLDIVGGGPLAERCRALICELGLQKRVVLHGAQSSTFVSALLDKASVFVQHSVTAHDGDTEGFGISIVEAMASCLPVVTTRHNGLVETVVDGITGLLVDEYDIEAMAAAIAALLADRDRAAAMGKAGRERVLNNFTIEKSRDRLRAIMGLPPLVWKPGIAV